MKEYEIGDRLVNAGLKTVTITEIYGQDVYYKDESGLKGWAPKHVIDKIFEVEKPPQLIYEGVTTDEKEIRIQTTTKTIILTRESAGVHTSTGAGITIHELADAVAWCRTALGARDELAFLNRVAQEYDL